VVLRILKVSGPKFPLCYFNATIDQASLLKEAGESKFRNEGLSGEGRESYDMGRIVIDSNGMEGYRAK